MARNDLYVNLGLNTSEFDSRLKKAFNNFDVLTKGGLEFVLDDKNVKFKGSKRLKQKLEDSLKLADGITYKTKDGKPRRTQADDISSAVQAYRYFNQLQKQGVGLSKKQADSYAKLASVMQNVSNLASANYLAGETKNRKERAKIANEVNKIRNSKDPNAEQDVLYRRRFMAFTQEQTKYENEVRKAQENAIRERNKRAQQNRAEYDRIINDVVTGASSSKELASMRSFYQEQEKLASKQASQSRSRLLENARNYRENARLKQSINDLTRAEQNYQSVKKSNKSSNIQEIQKEISALKQLIRAKEKNLRLLHGYNTTDPTLNNYRARLQSLQQQKQKLQELNSTYGRQSSILRTLGSLAMRYFSIYSVINFGKKVAETTGYFERQRVALEGITGSAAMANKVLSELTDFATHSPFQAKDLIGYAKQLSAFSIPAKDLVDTTKKLADVSAGLGVDMSRIILAYGQVKSASVLRGQELRQFTEAGIPLVEKLAKKFTDLRGELVTTGEVFEFISKRQVSFGMVDEILSNMTSEGGEFYKMQESISETMYGQIQKLSDYWAITLNEIGSSSSKVFMSIIKALQNVVKNIKPIAIAIAIAFSLSTINKFVLSFNKLIKSSKIFISTLKTARGIFSGLGGVFSMAIGAIVGLIVNAGEETRKLNRELNNIDKSFAKENSKMIGGLDSLVRKLQDAQFGTKAYSDAINTLSQNYGNFIGNDIINALNNTDQAARMTADSFSEIAKQVKGAIEAYNEYQAIQQKKEKVKEHIENKEETFSTISNWKYNVSDAVNKAFTDTYTSKLGVTSSKTDYSKYQQDYLKMFGSDASEDDIIRLIDKIRLESVSEFLNGESLEKDDFLKIFQNKINKYFPSGNKNNELGDIFYRDFYRNNSGQISSLKTYKDYEKKTDYVTSTKYFDEVDINKLHLTSDQDNIEQTQIKGSAYVSALKKTLDEMLYSYGMSESRMPDGLRNALNDGISGFDNSTVANINKLFEEFRQTFSGNPELMNWLKLVNNAFNSHVTEVSGRAQDINNRIGANTNWRGNSSIATFAQNYLATNDPDYKSKREQVKKDYDEKEAELSTYITKGGKDKNYIDKLKKEIETLRTLASADYYNIDLSKKTRSGSVENMPEQLSEFINRLKDAYTTYKTAVQSQGSALGVAYMKNDQKMFEKFGDFFHGATDNQSFNGIKIGGKSIGEMLQDAFLNGGMEDGVIDFEKAVKRVSQALTEYANKAPKQRKQFLSAAKALESWGDSTFAKDNVQGWIFDLNKEIQDLTKTFQRSSQQVEFYRKLLQNGTAGTLGSFAGESSKQKAFLPNSIIQLGNINEMIGLYNQHLKNAGSTSIPLSIETSELTSVAGIQSAIARVSEQMKMNQDTFTANPALGETGKTLESMLQNYLTTIISELESISGEKYTGNIMEDLAANLTSKTNVGLSSLTMQENVARQYGAYDYSAIKKMVDEVKENANTFFDTFINDQRFDVLAKGNFGKINFDEIKRRFVESIKDLPPILKEELERKLNDLELKVQNFNSSSGVLSSFGSALKSYKNAGGTSKRMYDDELSNYNGIGNKIKDAKSSLAIAQTQENKEEIDRIQKQLDELIAEQAASQEKLNQIGTNGENAKVNIQKQSLADMKASAEEAQSALNTISETVVSTINAFKSLSNAVNKAHDVMNDGENPEWMQDMDSFLSDFAEDFEALIAPIGAVIAMVIAFTAVMAIAGTEVTIALGVIVALIAVFAAVMAAFQQHDRSLQHDIDALDKKIEEFETAITNLNAAAERATGFDKLGMQIDAVGQNLSKASAYAKQAQLEEDKKNTDEDKVKEFKQKQQEAMDEFLNSMKDLVDELTASTEEWADAMSSSIRSAFQNGENAARAFRGTVKEMMGDVIENMLRMSILEPLMKEALEQWTGAEALKSKYTYVGSDGQDHLDSKKYLADLLKNINDPKKAKEFEETANLAGDTMIDTIEKLNEYFQGLYSFSSDSANLSGGIKSITEDTARRLEAVSNSQLGELVLIRSILQGYIAASGGYANSNMATIQSAVTKMNSNVTIIADMTKRIERHITDLRTSQVQPLHVTMV